ncbi:glucose dehydrogenase [FAD, quinone]-like isoform X1 [Rhopalosiphum padi]|uniref:glucose dehydrogenase [FAD, quinone]-like isoform X1 n=2 Tax=Rhopalosiphum padi TaxID=40932 RepID=UPI00298EA126|nr:glucose dehydrogenase [FAD, quinone]-like isoform X1 [Rhopalosiphum padi]
MFSKSLQLILCLTIIFNECGALTISRNAEFPPLFQSTWGYLEETLEWEAKEPINIEKVFSEYDFIVIGAGSAGAVVASRLSEIRKWKVLLIEAGKKAIHFMDVPITSQLLQASEYNWKYRTIPMNTSCLSFEEQRCKFPRGKVMGGSSVLNYMIYTRGNKGDYDNWAKMGNAGWSNDDVMKYFLKSENANLSTSDVNYHRYNGLLSVTDVPFRTPIAKAFVDAGSQIGLPVVDLNGENQIGINYIQATMKKGRRYSTNTAFLFPARMRSNLHVKKESTVTRIMIEKDTKKTIGVEFVSNRKKYRVYARKEVIVSGGTINSPQLLMLSGIGPKEHLKDIKIPLIKDLPVGENLMDHVALGGLSVLVNDTISLKTERLLKDPFNMYDYTAHNNGPYTIPGGAEALAFFDLDRPGFADGHPNLELLLISGLFSDNDYTHRLFGLKSEIYDKVYRKTENMDGFTVFPMIMRPKSKGRLWLKDANPAHYPLIDPNYFADETDLDVAVAGVRIFQQMLKTNAMKKLNVTLFDTPLPGCARHKFDSDAYWKCSARQISFTIYHLSGTCKMGPVGDPTAVVDPRLRVHGVKGLRVIDASIMPEVPAAHINAPTIMIGEKGADMIKEDWGIRI